MYEETIANDTRSIQYVWILQLYRNNNFKTPNMQDTKVWHYHLATSYMYIKCITRSWKYTNEIHVRLTLSQGWSKASKIVIRLLKRDDHHIDTCL